MALRNCAKCGKMYNYISGPNICDACKKQAEEKFQQVKAYIRENPTATLSQIEKDNDVKSSQLQQWIREERLIFAKGSPIELTCEKCGTKILTGRFCTKCKGNMADNLNGAFGIGAAKAAPKSSLRDDKSGMRFI